MRSMLRDQAVLVAVAGFVLFLNLGWVDTILPLVVPKFLAADAFFIFLLVQFFRGIPRELDEAAIMQHMRVLAARGDTSAALGAFEGLRLRLRDELGVSPGTDIRALHVSLLGAD